jgi:hypothetical protein
MPVDVVEVGVEVDVVVLPPFICIFPPFIYLFICVFPCPYTIVSPATQRFIANLYPG